MSGGDLRVPILRERYTAQRQEEYREQNPGKVEDQGTVSYVWLSVEANAISVSYDTVLSFLNVLV